MVVASQKEEEQEKYFRDALTFSKVMSTISQEEWILDSGCLIHICSKKEYFDTL